MVANFVIGALYVLDGALTLWDYTQQVNYYQTQINPDTNNYYTEPEAQQQAMIDLAPMIYAATNNIPGDAVTVKAITELSGIAWDVFQSVTQGIKQSLKENNKTLSKLTIESEVSDISYAEFTGRFSGLVSQIEIKTPKGSYVEQLDYKDMTGGGWLFGSDKSADCEGEDTLIGGDRGDDLQGYSGDDTLMGNGGDVICNPVTGHSEKERIVTGFFYAYN